MPGGTGALFGGALLINACIIENIWTQEQAEFKVRGLYATWNKHLLLFSQRINNAYYYTHTRTLSVFNRIIFMCLQVRVVWGSPPWSTLCSSPKSAGSPVRPTMKRRSPKQSNCIQSATVSPQIHAHTHTHT